MSAYVSIGQVCQLLGISLSTAYRRIKAGTLVSAFRTCGGHRRFDKSLLSFSTPSKIRIVTYSRVSSVDQKNDLASQSEKLKRWVEERYENEDHLHIQDLGSGLNYRKKGLNHLLLLIFNRQIDVLVLNHKDRLLRFGSELIFKLCSFNQVKVEIVEQRDIKQSFEQELANDVIELMTVFCARLYGKRSHQNKKKNYNLSACN